MSTDPDILGFSNPWYEEAISTAATVALGSGAAIQDASSALRTYIRDELADLRAEPYFDYAVDGATATYGAIGAERAQLVRARIDGLLA